MTETAPPVMVRGMWPYHPELLDRAVPRYTSYPTAAEFGDTVGSLHQRDALEGATGPVSLYVHIPFCERICWYCGCNTAAANRTQRLASYLDALHAEIDTVAGLLPAGTRIEQLAFGGGSPNAISPVDFVRLVDRLTTAFGFTNGKISVELDPRTFDEHWARTLEYVGVSRVSMGVQTFDGRIQRAIGRVQPGEMIGNCVRLLRAAGIGSINFDLMYGLPHQDIAALEDSLERACALKPERIALFGYAHVPHMLPRQRRIDARALPCRTSRFSMAARGHDALVRRGYRPAGFDHFALPDDSLSRAVAGGRLRRNFQGFTDDPSDTLIGLGASSISSFPGLLVQNEKNSGRYRMLALAGKLTGARGIRRGREERRRARIIEDFLCGRPVDLTGFYNRDVEAGLRPFLYHGLARMEGRQLVQTEWTAPYARTIAALFDGHHSDTQGRFSSAV